MTILSKKIAGKRVSSATIPFVFEQMQKESEAYIAAGPAQVLIKNIILMENTIILIDQTGEI